MTGLDRDAAREKLRFLLPDGDVMEVLLDALNACVRPEPSQTIDRDALLRLYQEWELLALAVSVEEAHARILALLRPIDGVVLTREEAVRVRRWYDSVLDGVDMTEVGDADLAARLEEAS